MNNLLLSHGLLIIIVEQYTSIILSYFEVGKKQDIQYPMCKAIVL